MITHIKRRLLW